VVFEGILGLLESLGLFQFVLPFILVFAVIWSILRITKILGEPKEAGPANAIVAVVFALFVAYFARIYDLGIFLTFFLSRGTIFIIIFLLAAVITNFLDKAFVERIFAKTDEKKKLVLKGFVFFISIAVVFAALSSSPFVGPILGFEGETAAFGADLLVSVFVLILLGGLLYLIMGI
jgi:hypothetical protein